MTVVAMMEDRAEEVMLVVVGRATAVAPTPYDVAGVEVVVANSAAWS